IQQARVVNDLLRNARVPFRRSGIKSLEPQRSLRPQRRCPCSDSGWVQQMGRTRACGPMAIASPRSEREPQAEPDLARHVELRSGDEVRNRLAEIRVGRL